MAAVLPATPPPITVTGDRSGLDIRRNGHVREDGGFAGVIDRAIDKDATFLTTPHETESAPRGAVDTGLSKFENA